jgi:hypothetical protein
MKPLSDSELQDWLDGNLSLDDKQLDERAKKDAALYETIYNELAADDHVGGAPMGFSKNVTQTVFFETERKKDRKQILLISALIAAIIGLAAIVIVYYNLAISKVFDAQFPVQTVLLIAFGLAVLGAIQYADKKWVRK